MAKHGIRSLSDLIDGECKETSITGASKTSSETPTTLSSSQIRQRERAFSHRKNDFQTSESGDVMRNIAKDILDEDCSGERIVKCRSIENDDSRTIVQEEVACYLTTTRRRSKRLRRS